jgi:hypothetical protein
VIRDANLSVDGRYRYTLSRRWDDQLSLTGDRAAPVVWVMLNPSTADHQVDDPTIRRCVGFSRREGYTALTVVNLFALRASDPKELARADDPVGPGNDAAIVGAVYEVLTDGGLVIAAWSAHQHPLMVERIARVREIARECATPLRCLGHTKAGHPRHPLYVRGDAPLELLGGADV